ncbi:MAG: AIR synthase-related protein, partial [Christensenella sp.]
CVGLVNKKDIINGSKIAAGDKILGLGSTGVHSNGFSLVRKLYAMDNTLNSIKVEKTGQTLGEMLLTPTKIYVKSILNLIEKVSVKGIAHITGGGFYENIPRVLPKNTDAKITLGSWDMPYVFEKLVEDAELSEHDAYNTFNMGIGMIAVVKPEDEITATEALRASGEKVFSIGEITEGSGCVRLC